MSQQKESAGESASQTAAANYVPAPQAASSDYLIGVHYFPGWKPGAHWGWPKILPFPERKPLLGWYNEANPEITDWEIKWALEHGIQFFLYCWYRDGKKIDQPMSDSTHRLGHAIHEGLFRARYGDKMKFAIMWETGGAGARDEKDLLENLLPYWMDTYFDRPNYLRIDGKPLLCIYSYFGFQKLVDPFGGAEGFRAALDKMRQIAAKRYGGLVLSFEYRNAASEAIDKIRAAGVDHMFAYCWHTKQKRPTIQEAIDRQMTALETWRDKGGFPFLTTLGMGWDPTPWASDDPKSRLYKPNLTCWKLPPEDWRRLLEQGKQFMDSMPESSPARRILLLDNWNEWGEGHYISPQVTDGFKYLQAVREVFTHRDNLPDYRTATALGLGPYDKIMEGQS